MTIRGEENAVMKEMHHFPSAGPHNEYQYVFKLEQRKMDVQWKKRGAFCGVILYSKYKRLF